MKDSLILQDENYISASRAHEPFGYTSDYVGQLCRAGKLKCKMIGRSWFVTEKSIIDHKSTVNELLKNKTKERRKISREIYEEVKKVEEAVVDKVEGINKIEVPVEVLVVKNLEASIVAHPIISVPSSFALPHTISKSFLHAPFYPKPALLSIFLTPLEKISVATVALVVGFMFLFQSTTLNPIAHIENVLQNTGTKVLESSAISSISSSIISFFTSLSLPKFAKNIFMKDAQVVKNDLEYKGLAVVPSTGSDERDEAMKNNIKESFSDEVEIKPDESGQSGVITPVFRKVKGDDFIYVLVPINE